MGTNRVSPPVTAVLIILFAGFAYFGFIGGESTRYLAGLCFVAAFLLIIIASLYDRETVGAGHVTLVYPKAGMEAGSRALAGPASEEALGEGILTPSEIVYLAGDHFVRPGGDFSGYGLAGSGVRVAKRELAEQVYATAFLAAERAGALRLGVRPKKTILGLRTVQAMYADPSDAISPYPANSLESRLSASAARICEKNGNEVHSIVYDLLPTCYDPFAQANHLVGSILAERGLLEVMQSKQLLVFTRTEVHLPGRTSALAAGRFGEVESLLRECQETRPEVWQMLIHDISKGIRSRTEQSDSGGMY